MINDVNRMLENNSIFNIKAVEVIKKGILNNSAIMLFAPVSDIFDKSKTFHVVFSEKDGMSLLDEAYIPSLKEGTSSSEQSSILKETIGVLNNIESLQDVWSKR